MNIDEKIAEFKTNIESCERVCEAIPTGTIRDAALRKANDCRQMVEWLEDYKRLKMAEEQSKWIPITHRPMTEEECEECKELINVENVEKFAALTCPLPEDGETVLISYSGYTSFDVFRNDDGHCSFEDTEIWEVTAWMPLPKPYKAESGGEE